MTCGECKYAGFNKLAHWCKKHEKRIKKWHLKCDDWIDMFLKKRLK